MSQLTRSSSKLPIPARLAVGIAMTLGLAACAGGGGVHGTAGVGSTSPPPPPPPPPPIVGTSDTRCQSATADCILTGIDGLTGDRNTRGGLRKQDAGLSSLSNGVFTFRGGTNVAAGELFIDPTATLVSDAVVGSGATLYLFGLVRGNVSNAGRVYANQYCDDDTTGICANGAPPGIDGDFQQSAGGAIRLTLGMPLHVTGHASLDGGVELVPQRIDHWSAYILPGAGTRQFILHADGGVSGQFSQWASRSSYGDVPGIFLQGSLGYGPTDAWFDVMRSSLQATMASAGSAKPIVESASVLDRAFALTDAWALQDARALTPAQRRMLVAAASIQHIDSIGQAALSLPSLAGVSQASALGRLVIDAQSADRMAEGHLDGMQPGSVAGDWFASGGGAAAYGRDRWVGTGWLLGTSMMASPLLSSPAQSTPVAGAYLRWYGDDGWFAGASASHQAGDLVVNRPIDLGPAGRARATSQRQVALTNLRMQGGRAVAWAGGRLTAFAALDATSLRSAESVERGNTGFELRMPASRREFVNGDAGVRYLRAWTFAASWLQVDLASGYRTAALNTARPLQASYVGLPELQFEVPDPQERGGMWTSLGVRGGERQGWNWAVDRWGQMRPEGHSSSWQFRIQREFP